MCISVDLILILYQDILKALDSLFEYSIQYLTQSWSHIHDNIKFENI